MKIILQTLECDPASLTIFPSLLYGLQNMSSEHVEAVLELELKLTECGD
jgi:hypothetical protein